MIDMFALLLVHGLLLLGLFRLMLDDTVDEDPALDRSPEDAPATRRDATSGK